MLKNKLGEDSPIPKFIHLKIRRWDAVESLMTLEEGEFKVPIDGCITVKTIQLHFKQVVLSMDIADKTPQVIWLGPTGMQFRVKYYDGFIS